MRGFPALILESSAALRWSPCIQLLHHILGWLVFLTLLTVFLSFSLSINKQVAHLLMCSTIIFLSKFLSQLNSGKQSVTPEGDVSYSVSQRISKPFGHYLAESTLWGFNLQPDQWLLISRQAFKFFSFSQSYCSCLHRNVGFFPEVVDREVPISNIFVHCMMVHGLPVFHSPQAEKCSPAVAAQMKVQHYGAANGAATWISHLYPWECCTALPAEIKDQ